MDEKQTMKKIIEARQSVKGLKHADEYLDNIEKGLPELENEVCDKIAAFMTEVKLARTMVRKRIAREFKRIRKGDRRKK